VALARRIKMMAGIKTADVANQGEAAANVKTTIVQCR
jgi:hypothetical protein